MTLGEKLIIECIQNFVLVPLFVAESFVSILTNAHKVTLNDPFHQLETKKNEADVFTWEPVQ